jgi:hypothetical protein
MIVTSFPDRGARHKTEEDLPLDVLARRIEHATAGEKSGLPLLKCARFGDCRTDKGSLRHNDNVLAIAGIEADYDGEAIGFDAAVAGLSRAEIAGIVYTSPSHAADAPRWRIVCPLSAEYPPAERDRFLDRLNGLFGGIFANESWTLSQSYYFGSVKRNPSHRVAVTAGVCIDQADQLDEGAIGKPRMDRSANGQHHPASRPEDITDARVRGLVDSLLDQVRNAPDGTKHNTLFRIGRTLGGYLHLIGWSEDEAVAQLVAALPPSVEDWQAARRTAADAIAAGLQAPLDLEDRPFTAGRSFGGDPPPPPPPGQGGPEPDDEPEPSPPPDPVSVLITEFNSKFAVVNENGKAIVYAPRHDPILRRRYCDRMAFSDLEKLFCNRFVQIGTTRKGKPIRRRVAELWLNHSDRRQYIGGVAFDPSGGTSNDVLNLWKGFAVRPKAGDWGLLQEHIRDAICGFDSTAFEYLLNWLADLLQHPDKQGEVAVVLCGPEGSGKGILARAVKDLLGQHGLAISNTKHLTSNFNSHLRDVVFLFADEAFYAGDKAHVGVLKAIVTEPYLTIEGKYQNAVQAPNFLHIMMASNEPWVVPASLDSRRWFVLDVNGDKIGNRAYFAAIQHQLENGGYEAMLYDLLQRDLSKVDLRTVPITEALKKQRKLSLDTTHNRWLDCLYRGYVFDSRLGLEDDWQKWHEFLPTEVLYASYLAFAERRRERHPLSREFLGRWIREQGGAQKNRPQGRHAVGEHMVDATTRRVAELLMCDRPRGYHLGSLEAARNAFADTVGFGIDWDDDQ